MSEQGNIRNNLWINGQWVAPAEGTAYDVEDPATGKVVGQAAAASPADAHTAVRAARAAFDDQRWSGMPARERSRILLRAASLMREHTEELAQAESLDVGKPITFARNIDVPNAADHFEYYGALAQQLDGSVRNTPLPALAYTRREPHGVVAAISPYNFPLILSCSKIAPALAAGNTVVHKPAPHTPQTAQLLAGILQEAGVPDGVYNLLTGPSPELGAALVEHPDVNAIAFTGSTAVGRQVARTAGEHLKPVVAELGGNGPNIIFEDADLEAAVNTAISGFIFNTGQFCMAGPRLLVQESAYEAVLNILEGAVPHVPVGRPSDPGTVIGPLISRSQLEGVEAKIQQALDQGGRLITGGSRLEQDGGFYLEPTVLADLPQDAPIIQEEVFGPVLTVQSFSTEEEAIRLANSTPYGLAAGLQSQNISRAHRVSAKLDAGIVWVNGWGMLDAAVPFGGVGDSGWGRESGPEALASYTRTKSVIVAVDQEAS